MTAQSDYLYVKKLYEEHADPETAVPMARYMRDQFRYYGLKSPIRRELVREFLKEKNKQDLDSSEFFINKAIGWALRDYSKTNPDWVRKFVDEYREQLAPLSVREASKYI